MRVFFFFAVLAWAGAGVSWAAAEDEQVVAAADCVKDKDIRRLEAQTNKTGCVLHYSKSKKTTEIAASRRGVELCREKLAKVRDTLTASGFVCK